MAPVQKIKQHAMDNYNNGWDFIVECYTDEEIQAEYLDACGDDVTKAIALIQEEADYRNEQSAEARREIESNTDTEEGAPMTKQVNYGLNEVIEGSHRTLSQSVEMYAIYYSDWTEVLEELSQYYASDEWKDSGYGQDLPRHVYLNKKRNNIIRHMHEIGAELRSVGIDVDLCNHSNPDEYFDQFDYEYAA